MSLIGWVKNNKDKVAKYIGGAIIVGGIVGETLITGEYHPQKWIAPGALIYSLGDDIDIYRTYARERLDKGTKIKLVGKGVKSASAKALGLLNLADPNLPLYELQNLKKILAYIAGPTLTYTTVGWGLERKGQKIKEKISKYFRTSKELKGVAESLENEKSPMSRKELKERLHEIEENLPNP